MQLEISNVAEIGEIKRKIYFIKEKGLINELDIFCKGRECSTNFWIFANEIEKALDDFIWEFC
jgi:hypothetical protein